MDHRVLTIRRWLLLALALIACAFEPGLWFCVFAAPVMFFKTVSGRTGILISDDGKIIFGDPDQDCDDCCGGGGDVNCIHCLDNEGPAAFELVISGLDECDGTFLCETYEFIDPPFGQPDICRWRNDSILCDGNAWPEFNITTDPSVPTTRRYTVIGAATGAYFLLDATSGVGTDCLGINISMPPTFGSATCQATAQ